MKKGKIVGLWILSIFFILSAMVYFPSFSSLISILIVVLAIPISKWQAILNKYIKGKLKLIIVITLALVTIFTAPNTEANAPDDTTATITTEASTDSTIESSSETTTASTTESTTTPTTESATEPTTTPTTAPTTEPTTAPTTEPTTAPTTEPTTAPTTEPTTAPTTEPTTVPTKEPPHTHSFSAATCTAPKTCSCGVTEGEAIGHSWKDATCTSPKICTICSERSGSAINHNYSNGKCSACGSTDPNYVSETMVWIPTHGGTKYHSKSSCSKMIDPIQVTKSEAINQGFEPCGRCY